MYLHDQEFRKNVITTCHLPCTPIIIKQVFLSSLSIEEIILYDKPLKGVEIMNSLRDDAPHHIIPWTCVKKKRMESLHSLMAILRNLEKPFILKPSKRISLA